MTTHRLRAIIVLGVMATAATASASPASTVGPVECAMQGRPYVDLRPIEQDLTAVVEFERSVTRYAMLHRQLEGPLPPSHMSADARVVREATDALALAIQIARKDAQRGEIFTPQVTRVFQKRIAACLPPEQWAEILAEHAQDYPSTVPALQVNGRWPGSIPFNYVPFQMLAVLPPLPAELQYRIVGRSLVLWDCHANVIVDIMPAAFTT
jgi:hypothetical protein